MANILIVDDEKDIRDALMLAVNMAGHQADTATNGQECMQMVAQKVYDLIILDVMMPIMDGLTTCNALRSHAITKSIPIIMLSARTTEVDKVNGLECGADDYIAKPFGIMELLSRIKVQLRKTLKTTDTVNELVFGSLKLNLDGNFASCGNDKLPLTKTEFDLLKLLYTNRGKVFSRDELLTKIWSVDYYGDDRVIDQHIKNLRSKLAKYSGLADIVTTVRGSGYMAGDLG